MKKISVILFFLFSISSFAQEAENGQSVWRVGVFFSTDYYFRPTELRIQPDRGYELLISKLNYTAGFSAQVQLSKKTIIGSGLSYSVKDFDGAFFCETCIMPDVIPVPKRITLRYIEAPVYWRYIFADKKVDLFLHAGLTPGVLQRFNFQSGYEQDVTKARLAVTGDLGLGVKFDVSKRYSINMAGSYRRSLISLRSSSVSLQTGIVYTLK